MDICRISRKEEFLTAFAAATRTEQVALLATIARDPPAPALAVVVLAVALPAVCVAALPRGAYLWVAATLLFSLVYPALFWLSLLWHGLPAGGDPAYLRTLRTLGILESGRKIGYLAANAFVINARASAPAFSWFAAVNLLIALGWLDEGPPGQGLGLVIVVQSAISLGYNLTIWRMTPGVGSLRARTAAVSAGFAAHRVLGWTVLVLLTVPVALGADMLLSLLVLPGPPVLRVLATGRVSLVGQALEFILLLAGLYVITRSVQSAESRPLARQVAEAVTRYIDDEARFSGGPETLPAIDCEEYRELATGLLEARVYRFARSTVAGRLPIYTLTPDLSLVADPETLGALRGHLNLEPAG